LLNIIIRQLNPHDTEVEEQEILSYTQYAYTAHGAKIDKNVPATKTLSLKNTKLDSTL